VPRKLAIIPSMYALSCTTPRLITTGPRFRKTARTGASEVSRPKRISGA
jgi:hypothetical protein